MIGGLLGSLVSFDTKGLSFVMTTMFLVVFLEQWLKEGKHYTALIGLAASILSLLFFGRMPSLYLPWQVCFWCLPCLESP